MNDGHPTGEVRPVIVRDVLNATGTQGASLRTRLWALPGRSGLSDACIMRRGDARNFLHVFYRCVLPNSEAPAAAFWSQELPGYLLPGGEREMHKKLTAGAATSFLLLDAAGVAMAQEEPATFPPVVVFSVEATSDVVVDPPIAAGDPCVDAVQALRAVPLPLREINVIQQRFLTFVFSSASSGAILVCAAEGTTPPPSPAP